MMNTASPVKAFPISLTNGTAKYSMQLQSSLFSQINAAIKDHSKTKKLQLKFQPQQQPPFPEDMSSLYIRSKKPEEKMIKKPQTSSSSSNSRPPPKESILLNLHSILRNKAPSSSTDATAALSLSSTHKRTPSQFSILNALSNENSSSFYNSTSTRDNPQLKPRLSQSSSSSKKKQAAAAASNHTLSSLEFTALLKNLRSSHLPPSNNQQPSPQHSILQPPQQIANISSQFKSKQLPTRIASSSLKSSDHLRYTFDDKYPTRSISSKEQAAAASTSKPPSLQSFKELSIDQMLLPLSQQSPTVVAASIPTTNPTVNSNTNSTANLPANPTINPTAITTTTANPIPTPSIPATTPFRPTSKVSKSDLNEAYHPSTFSSSSAPFSSSAGFLSKSSQLASAGTPSAPPHYIPKSSSPEKNFSYNLCDDTFMKMASQTMRRRGSKGVATTAAAAADLQQSHLKGASSQPNNQPNLSIFQATISSRGHVKRPSQIRFNNTTSLQQSLSNSGVGVGVGGVGVGVGGVGVGVGGIGVGGVGVGVGVGGTGVGAVPATASSQANGYSSYAKLLKAISSTSTATATTSTRPKSTASPSLSLQRSRSRSKENSIKVDSINAMSQSSYLRGIPSPSIISKKTTGTATATPASSIFHEASPPNARLRSRFEEVSRLQSQPPSAPLAPPAPRQRQMVSCYAVRSKAGQQAGRIMKRNQDSYIITPNFCKNKYQFFFSVCDGHGPNGSSVSQFIKQVLSTNIETSLTPLDSNNPSYLGHGEELLEAFKRTSDGLLDSDIDVNFSGSTCVSVFVTPERYICANVGDSRAILGRFEVSRNAWTSIALSTDHKPDLPGERHRIICAGGRIEPYKDNQGKPYGPARVWQKLENIPGLAMTRSFGDFAGSQVGVIAEPEIITVETSGQDRFLVIASDGLWEFLTNEDVLHIVAPFYASNDPETACEKLVRQATLMWRQQEEVVDDITVIIVFLHK